MLIFDLIQGIVEIILLEFYLSWSKSVRAL